MKTFNSIAKTVASFEKEIKSYANELKESFRYDDVMVEFTGFDFARESMTAEITMKTSINGMKAYNYFKVVASKRWSEEVNVDVVESNIDSGMHLPECTPIEHGYGARMMNF